MATVMTLSAVRAQLALKKGKKVRGLISKQRAGGFNGIQTNGSLITTIFPPGPIAPPKDPFGRGAVAAAGGGGGGVGIVGGGGGPSGGLAGAACNLLPGFLKDLCLLAAGLIPGIGNGTSFLPDDCPPGMVKIGGVCVDLTALPPGGDPAFVPANGVATLGGFGLPALTPGSETRLVRKCPRAMVLGIDNLCYPKAVLTGRSKFRKWRRPVRAPVTRRDVVAIRRAAGARDRVKELAKDVGLTVSAKRRSPKRHSEKHN